MERGREGEREMREKDEKERERALMSFLIRALILSYKGPALMAYSVLITSHLPNSKYHHVGLGFSMWMWGNIV